MPHHCAVPLCTSNSKTSPTLSFHHFPRDRALRAVWLKNIRRDQAAGVFEVKSDTRVCGLHFVESDYHDGGRQRDRQTSRRNKILKKDSVPTKFDCFPERLRPQAVGSRRAPRDRQAPPAKRIALQSKACSRQSAAASQCEPEPGPGSSLSTDRETDSLQTASGDTPREASSVQAPQPMTGSRESFSVAASTQCESKPCPGSSPSAEADSLQRASNSVGEPDHVHCKCVDKLLDDVQNLSLALQEERAANAKLLEALEVERDRRDFCLNRFEGSDDKIRYYTGFLSFGMFMACFNFLLASATSMRTWQGSRTRYGERTGSKPGPRAKLDLREQFFLVLVRLRRGLDVEDLADRFFVSPSTVSRTFTTWINLMYHKFQELPMWMSRRKVDKWMPPCFQKWYPTTRCIIDATEFFIEKPSSLARQSATWSNYKNHNTFKVLVGISPDGTITYISNLFEGSISDVDLVEQCGLLPKLERGDSLMADKGFDIQHLLTAYGVRLNIPPFRQGERQFTPEEVSKTQHIAAVRIHVERAINRIKQFRLLVGVMPNSLWDMCEQVVIVATYLCNFQPSLVG